jgi:hypothetical protein
LTSRSGLGPEGTASDWQINSIGWVSGKMGRKATRVMRGEPAR